MDIMPVHDGISPSAVLTHLLPRYYRETPVLNSLYLMDSEVRVTV